MEQGHRPGPDALRHDLVDTVELATSSIPPTGQWALWLDVGLRGNRALTATADLDNYAVPLASALPNKQLVSVWCSKRHGATSPVIAPAHLTNPPSARSRFAPPPRPPRRPTSIRCAPESEAAELADGPVRLQIAFSVGPTRNWMNLWKPTTDALDSLLGRTSPARDWHPRDDRSSTSDCIGR